MKLIEDNDIKAEQKYQVKVEDDNFINNEVWLRISYFYQII